MGSKKKEIFSRQINTSKKFLNQFFFSLSILLGSSAIASFRNQLLKNSLYKKNLTSWMSTTQKTNCLRFWTYFWWTNTKKKY